MHAARILFYERQFIFTLNRTDSPRRLAVPAPLHHISIYQTATPLSEVVRMILQASLMRRDHDSYVQICCSVLCTARSITDKTSQGVLHKSANEVAPGQKS